MKKILLLAALLALPSMVMAQGYVRFVNTSTTLITTNDNAGHVGSMDGLNGWSIGLFVAPVGTVDTSTFVQVGQTTNRVGAFRGQFTGGDPYQIPNNAAIGTEILFQVRAWSFGTTYAASAWKGSSGVGRVTPSSSSGPFPALFGTDTAAGQLNSGFVISPPVPEPSSIALGLLGLGAVALFRRRK